MIVEGTYTFAAPIERVWELLLDPAVMAAAMPGAEDLRRVADDRYEGVIRIGVGPITAAEFTLAVTLRDVLRPSHYTMDIDSRGRFGFTRGQANVNLAAGNGGTQMVYRADLQVGGKIAGVGQRMLDSISKLMTRQGLEALSKEVERQLAQAPAPASPAPPAPPAAQDAAPPPPDRAPQP
jgi:carbon monoxide dehydrogenase subunit G